MVLPVVVVAGASSSARRRQQLLRFASLAALALLFLCLNRVQHSIHSRTPGSLTAAAADDPLRQQYARLQIGEEAPSHHEDAIRIDSNPLMTQRQQEPSSRIQRYRRSQEEAKARQQQLRDQREKQQVQMQVQVRDQQQQQQQQQRRALPEEKGEGSLQSEGHPSDAQRQQQQQQQPWVFEDDLVAQGKEALFGGSSASKLLLSKDDGNGGEAAGAVVSVEVHLISPERPAGDLQTALSLNSERRLSVPVPSSGVHLAGLRVPLTRALGLERGDSSFRFLVWNPAGSCLQPLGRWEEAHEPPGLRSGGQLVVARNSALGLPDSQQWAPFNILFWQKHPPLPPGGRLASIATRGLASGLVCRRWGAEQYLHAKVARERSFWVGLDKPPPLGGRNENWAVETMGRDAMQYFGWHEMGVAKNDAAVVIRGGWDWTTIFADTRPGLQLIMRHPNNNNLTAKDLLYWNLRNQAREGRACIPVERMVPLTFLTDDPEDCGRLREAISSAPPGTTWVRKVADLHVGQGITPLQELKPGDCKRASGSYQRSSKVVYQGRMEPLKMNGRPLSLRSYVLVASLEPLVLAFNHHAGHVYIAGEQVMRSSNAWYTQHHSFEAWTFERFDEWLTKEQGKPGYFRDSTLPQMKDAILAGIKAARKSFTSSDLPAPGGKDASGNRIWDTGHGLGSLGNFDLWCIDFMYDTNFNMRMLEMTDSCLFKGYREQEQVRQRMFMMKDSLELTVAIQSRVLQHEPITDLFPSSGWRGAPTTRSGNFELLYSEVPGSEFDYLEAEERCSAGGVSRP